MGTAAAATFDSTLVPAAASLASATTTAESSPTLVNAAAGQIRVTPVTTVVSPGGDATAVTTSVDGPTPATASADIARTVTRAGVEVNVGRETPFQLAKLNRAKLNLQRDIDMPELKDAIHQLGRNMAVSSTGTDIRSLVVSATGSSSAAKEIRNHFLQHVREEWLAASPADDLTTNRVTPIYKGSSDATLPVNYRAIAVPSCISKLLQVIVCKRLTAVIMAPGSGLLSHLQAGFAKSRSTLEQVLIAEILESDAAERGVPLYTAFLDLKRAFPSVSIAVLLQKLHVAGITGRMWMYMKKWLCNQKAFVQIGTSTSRVFELLRGVPEGCVWSPLVFLLYFNELLCELQRMAAPGSGYTLTSEWEELRVSCLAFADDVLLVATSAADLQHMLDVCSRLASKLRLVFNVGKAKTAYFKASLVAVTAGAATGAETVEAISASEVGVLHMKVERRCDKVEARIA